jgi:omega-hydroxy-beta-dihydromenaquinone-9 sulfotransferase
MTVAILPSSIRQQIVKQFQKNYLTFSVPPVIGAPLKLAEDLLYGGQLEQIAITQPIFIVGCHRSGTTVLYDALCQHPDLAYLTNASVMVPETPIINNAIGKLLGLDQVSQERFLQDGIPVNATSPNEGIRIWELHAADGGDYCLDETYSNPEMEAYLQQTIRKHLKYFNASRFINKNPDNSVRMRYLNKLFSDAFFINIIRDGRAVCSSLLKVREISEQFFGADNRHAKSGIKVKAWAEIEAAWVDDPIRSIGLLWLEVVETIERDRQHISPERYIELRYEDFVAEPLTYFRKLIEFCQLPWNDSIEKVFQAEAAKIDLGGRNDAWKKRLNDQDVERLLAIIGPKMREYGYSV